MGGFSAEWLALREPYDHRSRAAALMDSFWRAARARRGERSDGPIIVLDIGAGTGSALRSLAPRMAGDQHWLLADDALTDEALSALAVWAMETEGLSSTGESRITIVRPEGRITAEICVVDVADLASLPFDRIHGVVTSAFLDLCSADWLSALALRSAAHQVPVLAQLTVDGRQSWNPAHADDALVLAAFEADQARDKGLGPALGARAAELFRSLMQGLGYTVSGARSDWRFGAEDRAIAAALADGVAEPLSVRGQGAEADRWRADRLAAAADGRLTITIGHVDLLAVPANLHT